MSQLAKWFGASVVVHLAAAGSVVVLTPGNALRSPDSVLVVLDTPARTVPVRHGVSRTAVPVAVAAAAPPRTVAPRRPEPVRRVAEPATLPAPAPSPVRDEDRAEHLPAAPPAVRDTRTDSAVPAAPEPRPAPAVTAPVPPEPAGERYRKEHFAYIRELIARRLEYPPLARRMKWQGKTVVTFTIAADGTARAIRVTGTSGYPVLDSRAVATVERASPFPKPPVAAEIVVPVTFILAP